MPLYPPPPTSGSTTLAALTDVDTTGKADEDSLTWEASSSRWVPQAVSGSGIAATLFDAKGDLIVASAADTAAREAVGADGTFLEANAASTNGIRWGTPGGSGSPAVNAGALIYAYLTLR